MSPQRQPSTVQVPDDVYPLYPFDNEKSNRCYVSWLMIFNDVLDAQKLNDALIRLLEIGDWKKLGGRLRLKENGDLEIHHVQNNPENNLPKTYFTHQTFDMEIQTHPVASRFPTQTEHPSIQFISDDFKPFVTRSSFPTFQQMLQENLPTLSLHVSSFRDATLVSLVWPHALMDGFGGQALLSAWSLVLAGQEEYVPAICGAREDILLQAIHVSEPEKWEELKLERSRLRGFSLCMFSFRYLWNKIWDPPRTRGVIFFSEDAMKKIKDQAQEYTSATGISEAVPTRESQSEVFVSSGDAIIAWATRAVALSEPTDRPITILSLLNARFRLPEFISSTGVFLQNLTLGTYTFLSSQEARGSSISPIALSHRRHFTEQASEEQVSAFLRSGYQAIDIGQTPGVLFGESDALPIVFNNMVKADLMRSTNFGPAVVRQGNFSENRTNPPGTMVMYYNENVGEPYKGFNLFTNLGQDHGGNYWLWGTLLPRAWDRMEEELKKI